MAREWYLRDRDQVLGPFTGAELKAQAAASRIKPETPLRKGRRGSWTTAGRVKGLFGAPDVPAANAAAHPPAADAATRVAVSTEEEGTYLAPLRDRRKRLIVLLVLVGLVAVGTTPWYQKAIFAASMALIVGSFPIVQVKRKTIEQTLVVGFCSVHRKSWQLRDFVGVETDVEQRISQTIGILVLFFWVYWLLFRIFDYVLPWLGGDYKLWLRQYDDDRLLIWQGNNSDHYEANLRLFESKGLPIG